MLSSQKIDILGAGAAGLFCAGLLAERGFQVTVLDNGKKVGRKILMSGGGFCNFTNLTIEPQRYLSQNPHFCKSALKRFTQWDFIALVEQHGIPYHEKELGQLFCDRSAADIVALLMKNCQKQGVQFELSTTLNSVTQDGDRFCLETSKGTRWADKVIVATGGLSLPKLGATPIGYQIAQAFDIPIVPVHAGLVPFTLDPSLLTHLSPLSGIALPIAVTTADTTFHGNLLFTHRGLSGPAMLQISNYWQPGTALIITLFPEEDAMTWLLAQQKNRPDSLLKTVLSHQLPKRVVEQLITLFALPNKPLKQLTPAEIAHCAHQLSHWEIFPNATEGYRTAEVTLGGVDTNFISSKTMACRHQPNLYFIGEVLDVTGWLGGYNFQWAWSSAYACASEMSF